MNAPSPQVLIVGGGLSGLMCAQRLERAGIDYRLVEKDPRLGGLVKTLHLDGFQFDHTGHFLHLKTPEMRAFVENLPVEWRSIERKAAISIGGKLVPYPFQLALYHLPDEIKRECLMGAIEAYRASAGGLPADASFLDWITFTQGAGIAKWFMVPYNTKLLDIPLDRLGTDQMGRFMPRVDIEGIVDGTLRDRTQDEVGYNARFLYPASGGIEALPDAIAGSLRPSRIACGAVVTRIDVDRRRAFVAGGGEIPYRRVVSSMPLPALARIAGGLPDDLRYAAASLKATTVFAVLLGWRGEPRTDLHWIYLPDPNLRFYRVGFPTNIVGSAAPAGRVSAYVETSRYCPGDAATADESQLIADAVDLVQSRLDLVGADARLEVSRVIRISPAYVLYDRERADAVSALLTWFRDHDVQSIGRYGSWTYSSMEDSLLAGDNAANAIVA